LGNEKTVEALRPFDRFYHQPNEESALQQVQIQLANPLPYDLEELNLVEYRNLDPCWQAWETVKSTCVGNALLVFDELVGLEA